MKLANGKRTVLNFIGWRWTLSPSPPRYILTQWERNTYPARNGLNVFVSVHIRVSSSFKRYVRKVILAFPDLSLDFSILDTNNNWRAIAWHVRPLLFACARKYRSENHDDTRIRRYDPSSFFPRNTDFHFESCGPRPKRNKEGQKIRYIARYPLERRRKSPGGDRRPLYVRLLIERINCWGPI